MRIALALVIALAFTACAKKSPPPAAPATTTESKDAAPSEAPAAPAPDGASDETGVRGDPCDGGEGK